MSWEARWVADVITTTAHGIPKPATAEVRLNRAAPATAPSAAASV